MNNLKLDIFGHGLGDGGKMKRLFPNRKSKHSPTIEHPSEMAKSGHTLDRIVNAKEEARKQWLEQQEDFARKRQEHEMKMIAMEEAEVSRREEEVRKRNDELDDQKRKNRMVQEAVAAQIRTLQEKLDEYKISHKSDEESMEDEITTLEDTLTDVKSSLEKRKRALQDEMMAVATSNSPSSLGAHSSLSSGHAPSAPTLSLTSHGDGMYPTLPAQGPLSRSNEHFAQKPVATRRSYANSSGSSPQMSLASSSRSATPKADSDFDGSV
eukprot:maker-scaffold494_size155699-snap-gene-0.21 protein:Tk10270 transcript:maker-scaffold494_size155699-snap-gene-0.21-mRNA-1 annotation:"multispecies: rna-binding protein"